MIAAFFQSIKYVGHLWPVTLLRWVLGYSYVQRSLERYHEGQLNTPYLTESIRLSFETGKAPDWYPFFLESFVQQNWKFFTYALIISELLVGLSYLVGFMVRPMAVLAFMISLQALWAMGSQHHNYYLLLTLVHMMFFLLGAGRCLGVDYYFFRKRRGLWW